jgi:predicted N-acyltransferase
LKIPYTFKIYDSTSNIPKNWDDLAKENIFLRKSYLEILEASSPKNMTCNYIGLFEEDKLVGIIVSQFLDLNQLDSFGDRDKCLKKTIRNFIFKNFSSYVLLIGNNMLTGQNAFSFSKEIEKKSANKSLLLIANQLKEDLKKKGKKVHITTFKDFYDDDISNFNAVDYNDYFKFSTQPNMIFKINENWNSDQDYFNALSKKYRDQFKRARKKADGIEKRKMHLEDIVKFEKEIYDLYYYVAKNAPFNTFFLRSNHFKIFKEKLKDNFLFYGYFIDEKLVGFNTLIKNGSTMDTYFLGYDEKIQREKMLYLNMLYDMIGYSINKGFKEIVFARTALEIKSSVGAKPEKMFGYIKHSNSFVNKYMSKIFPYLEPETIWQERNPFK